MYKVKCFITVYLALVLGIILIFIMAVIECVRYQTFRMQAECVMDAGLNSIFAEYNREMIRQYGLLYIDDSYGGIGNPDNTKNQLLKYLNINMNTKEPYMKFLNSRVDNCELTKVSYSTDQKGLVFRYQIHRYMDQNSNKYADFNRVDLSGYEEEYDQYNQSREGCLATIDEIITEYNRKLIPGEEPVSVSNPADAVEFLSTNNVLIYGFDDMNNISTNSAEVQNLISHRNYSSGMGLYASQIASNASDDEEFMSYVFDRLGFFGKSKSGACLNYQIEYMIAYKNSDIDNIGEVLSKIFKARYVINIKHIEGCSEKKNEAHVLAEGATAYINSPILTEAVYQSLLYAWAYAESAKDIRILMDGNSLGNAKSEADWNLQLMDIPTYRSELSSYIIPSGDINYKDYLYNFLILQEGDKQNVRCMDIMEMDIRNTLGNESFCMNNLIYQLEAIANFSCIDGKGLEITRKKSYW